MKRISLTNTAFEGNNNVYLFDDGPETVLVDTGDSSSETARQLSAALADHTLTFADIDRIILTHWHHDHTGLAGEIQSASNAHIFVHEADAPLVRREESAWLELEEAMHAQYERWEIPHQKQAELAEFLDRDRSFEKPLDVTGFSDGTTFSINGTTLTAVHISGHAKGLCLFEIDTGGGPTEILSGDALLPEYTPNVGGADLRVDRPLQRYISGLRRIVSADYSKAWPGHREPIADPSTRAETIIRHHEERAWRVLDSLERHGPSSVWAVSADLFGSLAGIHILHGPGEAYAHLDHLERSGAVRRIGSDYRITDRTATKLRELENSRWSLGR